VSIANPWTWAEERLTPDRAPGAAGWQSYLLRSWYRRVLEVRRESFATCPGRRSMVLASFPSSALLIEPWMKLWLGTSNDSPFMVIQSS
jgi:hypothetical protein